MNRYLTLIDDTAACRATISRVGGQIRLGHSSFYLVSREGITSAEYMTSVFCHASEFADFLNHTFSGVQAKDSAEPGEGNISATTIGQTVTYNYAVCSPYIIFQHHATGKFRVISICQPNDTLEIIESYYPDLILIRTTWGILAGTDAGSFRPYDWIGDKIVSPIHDTLYELYAFKSTKNVGEREGVRYKSGFGPFVHVVARTSLV